jgi:hypothetical protein
LQPALSGKEAWAAAMSRCSAIAADVLSRMLEFGRPKYVCIA